MMQTPLLTEDKALQDIESIYQRAFADGKWSVALRAKEMQCKIMGFFKPQHLPNKVSDMTNKRAPTQIMPQERSMGNHTTQTTKAKVDASRTLALKMLKNDGYSLPAAQKDGFANRALDSLALGTAAGNLAKLWGDNKGFQAGP